MVDTERVLAECVIELVAAHGGTLTMAEFGHLFGSTEADDEWDVLLAPWGLTSAQIDAQLAAIVPARIAGLPLLPGVRELLDLAASRSWPVGLATGQNRGRVEARLGELGVRFDAIVTAADVARGKPAPDIFLAAADQLGVAACDCTVLEDSVPGAHAALAAGMRVIVCPSLVSAACTYPDGAVRVDSLTTVDANFLAY